MKIRFLIIALAICLSASAAKADMFLMLDDGAGNSVSIADDDHDGQITYNGNLGGTSSWIVNVSTGLGSNVLGPSKLDLNTVNVSNSAGILTIVLTETNIPYGNFALGGILVSAIGGTTDGEVDLYQILDEDNSVYPTISDSDIYVHNGPLVGVGEGGAFSGSGSFAFDPLTGAGLLSLTERVTITHGAGTQSTSFDAESSIVPVPGAVLLGLLGLSAAGIKLRRKNA